MKKGYIFTGVIVAIFLFLGVSGVSAYNNLTTMDNDVAGAEGQINVVLQYRMDLIPNIVNAVKGTMGHEKAVIDSVTDARAKLAGAQSMGDKAEADGELSGALSRLLVVTESYPDIKANEQVKDLIVQLETSENRVQIARQDYNTVVSKYNLAIRKIPTSLYAGALGFESKELFEAAAGAEFAPTVDLSFDN